MSAPAELNVEDGRVGAREDGSELDCPSIIGSSVRRMRAKNWSRSESSDRCKFQISTKLENKFVRSARESKGVGSDKDDIRGVKKC